MRKVICAGFSALLLACGGPSEVETEAGAVAIQRAAASASERVVWPDVWPKPSGREFLSADCLGDQLRFVGTIWYADHQVSAAGRDLLQINWDIWWEPAQFTSVATGDVWDFAPGFNNHGVFRLGEAGGVASGAWHERIPLVNRRTGAEMVTHLRALVVRNAEGDIKTDSWEFYCEAK